MGFFDAFREKPSATRYGEIHPTANFDVFDATLIYVFCALAFSFFILLPGYMLKEVRPVNLSLNMLYISNAGPSLKETPLLNGRKPSVPMLIKHYCVTAIIYK
jgi:hypothetical protein